MLDPTRGRAGSRGDDATWKAEGHRALGLEQAVEDPEEPEGDPYHPAGHRLGVGRSFGGRYLWTTCGHRPSIVEGANDVPGQDQENREENDDPELMLQRGAEGGTDRRVVVPQPVAHSRHVHHVGTKPLSVNPPLEHWGLGERSPGSRPGL